jgi:hypothetical protein
MIIWVFLIAIIFLFHPGLGGFLLCLMILFIFLKAAICGRDYNYSERPPQERIVYRREVTASETIYAQQPLQASELEAKLRRVNFSDVSDRPAPKPTWHPGAVPSEALKKKWKQDWYDQYANRGPDNPPRGVDPDLWRARGMNCSGQFVRPWRRTKARAVLCPQVSRRRPSGQSGRADSACSIALNFSIAVW